jgi:hypothetical protein
MTFLQRLPLCDAKWLLALSQFILFYNLDCMFCSNCGMIFYNYFIPKWFICNISLWGSVAEIIIPYIGLKRTQLTPIIVVYSPDA